MKWFVGLLIESIIEAIAAMAGFAVGEIIWYEAVQYRKSGESL